MPVETIKCQQCGSAEVTEFKPGSYVCGHCDAVFRHVSPSGASGGCEIDGCGVPAVGRCGSCNRRFCRTHTGSAYAVCAECQAVQAATSRQQDLDRGAAAGQRELDRVAALQRKLESIGDPTERLVRALHLLCEVKSRSSVASRIDVGMNNLRVLFNVCPELWPASQRDGKALVEPRLGNDPPVYPPLWNAEVVARGFASRAQAVGLKPDGTAQWRTFRTNMFGKPTGKVSEGASEPAWVFPEGSNNINRSDDYETAYVFPDGRLLLTRIAGSDPPGMPYNLRGVALKRMGELLEGS